jgi:hypothetical protein
MDEISGGAASLPKDSIVMSCAPNICLRRYDTCALTSLKSTKVELRNTRISVAKSAIPLAPYSGIFAQSCYFSDELSRMQGAPFMRSMSGDFLFTIF